MHAAPKRLQLENEIPVTIEWEDGRLEHTTILMGSAGVQEALEELRYAELLDYPFEG